MSEVKTRPCYVNGRKGLFHRWIEREDILVKCEYFLTDVRLRKILRDYEKGIEAPNCKFEKIKITYALIEFEDGHMEEIPPTTITFFDSDRYFDAFTQREERFCADCKYLYKKHTEEPCVYCKNMNQWEPKGGSND